MTTPSTEFDPTEYANTMLASSTVSDFQLGFARMQLEYAGSDFDWVYYFTEPWHWRDEAAKWLAYDCPGPGDDAWDEFCEWMDEQE